MTLFVYRNIAIFLEIFCGTMAAFIILGYNPRKLWSKAIFLGVLMCGLSNLTYLIEHDGIRHLVNWILVLILIKLVFSQTWWESIKIIITMFLFNMIPSILTCFLISFFVPLSEFMTERFWVISVILMFPIYSIILLLVYVLRWKLGSWKYFLNKVRSNPTDLLFFSAVIMQVLLIFLCLSQSFAGIQNLWKMYSIYAGWILITGLNFFIIFTAIRSRERRIMSFTESMISNNVNDLVNSIRSQRHDFGNHLQVISALHYNGQKEELGEYLSGLNADISFYNQLLKVDNPFIAALLNAKVARADIRNVKLETQIDVPLSGINRAILEIVRILGNLIDNAIEAVEQSELVDRWVRVIIYARGPLLVFEIINPGFIQHESAASLFQPGYTSKKNMNHEGFGLYSAYDLARKLGGQIEYCLEADQITFSLIIPR